MPVSAGSELDCEWVVGRCKSYLERGDRHGAKAWILTARSLFPGDFAVQVGWCAVIGMQYVYARSLPFTFCHCHIYNLYCMNKDEAYT